MITIDVFSDIACPWCYIGHRRLRRAIDELAAGSVQVRPRAFELQPQLPPEGVPARAFFERKFGGAGRTQAIFDRVTAVGREDGIAFDFERINAPNTRLAHRTVALAGSDGIAALDALFCGHFELGIDLASIDAIEARLGDAKVSIPDLRERLAADGALDVVLGDEREAAELGVDGVPFFVANGRLALSGAQDHETFRRFLAAAAAS